MKRFDYANPPDVLGCLPENVVATLGIQSTNLKVTLPKYVIHKHIKRRHEVDFDTWEAFKKHVEAMPEILESPEYVGFHSDRNSIKLVKRIDEITVLALKISSDDVGFEVKTLFPITDSKLKLWVQSGEMIAINP